MMLNNISVPMLGLAVIILALTTGRLRDRIEALEAARRPRLAAATQGAPFYDPRLPALERSLREWKPEYAPAFAEWLSRCDPWPTTPDEFAYEQAAFIEYMVVNPAAAKTGARNDGE